MTVLRIIRILVIIQLFKNTCCQDGFGDRDILRYQQMGSDDGQIEAINSFSIIQREPNTQALSSSGQQFEQYVENASKNEDYSRTGRRKVYRIKNPFQTQVDESERAQETMEPQDSSTGASNQYAAMQYSLPPEEFLQQLRAENQYYQQQQVSTPAPNLGFTVTPQPHYQYSTASPSSYDSNQHSNQMQQAKNPPVQSYLSSPSSYQYSTPSSFSDTIQSTSSPVTSYLSTPMNGGQYVGTQSSSYVSSASPVYLSSPPNLQQYVSSPMSIIHTGSPDYNNRVTTAISNSFSYDNDLNKKNQYDYSSNTFRYPINIQQQYQNDYSSTTTTTSAPYPMRESWQNSGVNALSKSLQEVSFTQYQNYPYTSNQQDVRSDTNTDSSSNSDTHRIGSLASANNMYMNYAQPDHQMSNNFKIRTRDLENETGQKEYYSNGDYGWKLTGKKPLTNNDVYTLDYPKYQTPNLSSDSVAVSQMNFHMDTSKPYNHEQLRSSSDNIESQEFAKAAAKAHERLKQQQQYYNNNYGTNNDGISYYSNDKQKNKYADSLNVNNNQYSTTYSNTQNDLITVSPYLISNSRDVTETKTKQPFDHDKALKTIVPIDVSNVVGNSAKQNTNLEYNNRLGTSNYGKDQLDHNLRQYIRPVSDSYYTKDKNSVYTLNIKNKPEEYVSNDSLKQIEAAIYAKQQQIQEQTYNQGYSSPSQNYGYNTQASSYQDNMQSPSMQQPGLQRNHNTISQDIASLLKLSDVPYRLTQGLSNDALKLHNINFDQGGNIIPTPLPTRINQNVDSHQLDVATSILNKLLLNKQSPVGLNRPENENMLPTINGFKVANPFNLDLKFVAEMLKGKPTIDDSYMTSMRDTYTKATPIKLDLSQFQHLLNNENSANLASMNDGFSSLNNPYLDNYNNGRFPYQGVKYSRSQEEEESIIPISDTTNTHPIGAVIEQDDSANEREASAVSDLTAQSDDVITSNFDDSRSKHLYLSGQISVGDRRRNPNSSSARHTYQRKHPKSDIDEPYPLLKPPPARTPVARSNHIKMEKNRRRRVIRPKFPRYTKTEPLFEAGADPESLDTSVPILLRPPPVAESKSDTIHETKSTLGV